MTRTFHNTDPQTARCCQSDRERTKSSGLLSPQTPSTVRTSVAPTHTCNTHMVHEVHSTNRQKKRTVYFCQFAVEWSNNSHLKWFKNSSFTINQHLQRWKWYKQRQMGFPFIISIFIYWIWRVNNGHMANCGFINASPVIFLQLESHRTWTRLLSCDWTWCFPCFLMLKKIIWSISWKSSHVKIIIISCSLTTTWPQHNPKCFFKDPYWPFLKPTGKLTDC